MNPMPRAAFVDVGGTLWSELSMTQDVDGKPLKAEYSVLNPAARHRAVWERRLLAIGIRDDEIAELCNQLDVALRPAVTSDHFDVWGAIDGATQLAGIVGVEADRIRSACCIPAQDFTALLPGARDLLVALKHTGSRVVIASNAIWRTEADYWSDFRAFGLDGLIDAVVCSVDLCWRKPCDRFFDAALDEAGVAAEECLMIGNSEDKDIVPSKARGMRAIRVAIEEPLPSASAADAVYGSLDEVSANYR
ncbi:MAG TPA: HAD family hydrolase [Candidatus Dormibacteraeota bacterium]